MNALRVTHSVRHRVFVFETVPCVCVCVCRLLLRCGDSSSVHLAVYRRYGDTLSVPMAKQDKRQQRHGEGATTQHGDRIQDRAPPPLLHQRQHEGVLHLNTHSTTSEHTQYYIWIHTVLHLTKGRTATSEYMEDYIFMPTSHYSMNSDVGVIHRTKHE